MKRHSRQRAVSLWTYLEGYLPRDFYQMIRHIWECFQDRIWAGKLWRWGGPFKLYYVRRGGGAKFKYRLWWAIRKEEFPSVPQFQSSLSTCLLTFTLIICFCSGIQGSTLVSFTCNTSVLPRNDSPQPISWGSWEICIKIVVCSDGQQVHGGKKFSVRENWEGLAIRGMQAKTTVRYQPNFTKVVPIRKSRSGPLGWLSG